MVVIQWTIWTGSQWWKSRKVSNTILCWGNFCWIGLNQSKVVGNVNYKTYMIYLSHLSCTNGREGIFTKCSPGDACDNVRSCAIRIALNVKPLLLRIERLRYSSYVGSATWPECLRKNWRDKSWLQPTKIKLPYFYVRTCWVLSWCGASRTIRYCWKPRGFSSSRTAA